MTEQFYKDLYQLVLLNGEALVRVYLDEDGDVRFEVVEYNFWSELPLEVEVD